MSFQIRHVVVYGREDRVRRISFNLGSLNIITGASRRGKSAILTIIDYCLGSSGYPVKAGVARDYAVGFAIMIVVRDGYVFVARPAPERLRATTDRMHVSFRDDDEDIPSFDNIEFNTNMDTARQILGDLCGIDGTLRLPAPGTSGPIPPGIRHSLFFVMQEQNEIANQDVLFHTQAEEYRPNAIRAVIPYFLGAVDVEYAALVIRLRTLKRDLATHRRALGEREQVLERGGQARALLAEAAAVGLLAELPEDGLSEDEAILLLRQLPLIDVDMVRDPESAGGRLSDLNENRRDLRGRLNQLNIQISRLRRAADENTNFVGEVSEQRARLATLNLYETSNSETHSCPLCGNHDADASARWEYLSGELARVEMEIVAVRNDSPKIGRLIADTLDEIQEVTTLLRANRTEIDELEAGVRALAGLRDSRSRMALVQGRIGLYLEMLDRHGERVPILDRTGELEAEIEQIEGRLLENGNPDLLETFISLISQNIWDKARTLQLEHSQWPIRLDVRRLTVVADTPSGAIQLKDMGSGENYVGYHLATFLALHEWFDREERPVPRLLIIDQPSQVWFPKDYSGDGGHTLPDEDRSALVRLYEAIMRTVDALSPRFQVIVMEHADLEEEWFQEAVEYRWRESGEALIPAEWIESAN
nr:DUF3732 domain-containing protein [Dactylosporangium thailandense]